MARNFLCGFEVAAVAGNAGAPDMVLSGTGAAGTFDSVAKRSGRASVKLTNTSTNAAYMNTNTASATQVASFWFYIQAAPPSNVTIASFHYTTGAYGQIVVLLNTNLSCTIQYNNGAGAVTLGTTSKKVLLNSWNQVQIRKNNAGGTAAGRLNGEIFSISGLSWVAAHNAVRVGTIDAITAWNIWVDDLVCDDTETWIGGDFVLTAYPIADGQAGTWTLSSSGGTTNLYQTLDNFPPEGQATDDDAKMIESADSSGDNSTDEYRGTCQTYTALGILPSDTIKAIQYGCWHAEDVASGTKTGSFGGQANPAVTYGTFTAGNNAGAAGTFPTNWFGNKVIQDSPTVTRDSALVIGLRKTDGTTGVVQACALYAYIDVERQARRRVGMGFRR